MMWSSGRAAPPALIVTLMLSFGALIVRSDVAKTESRVCLAGVANYTLNTAIGLCSQAVLQTLRVGASGTVGYVTTATTPQTTVLNLLPTFCDRRVAYPYLQPYLAVVGAGTDTTVANMLASATIRANFINALVAFVKSYPNCVGIFIDFSGLTVSQAAGYSNFMAQLFTAAGAASLSLATSLPWDSLRFSDIYYNPTLPNLPFNVLRTYDDMYDTLTSTVHPNSPLFAMNAPFNDMSKTIYQNLFRWVIKGFSPGNIILGIPMYARSYTVSMAAQFGSSGTMRTTLATYCQALLFSTRNGVQVTTAGESISSSNTLAYVFNTFAGVDAKLNFAKSNNLGGVALFSLSTSGGQNAELLRYVTSVLAPTPPTGYSYPVATTPTCGVTITFPTTVPLTTTAQPTTTVAGGTTTAAVTTTLAGATTAAGGATTAAG
uniref:GH18 domain-containing protein n=1 Tax=Anopheles farauti TaxID=69004 RepID=A0A182QEY5_9DIPT